jgi:blocked early in transport 1
LKILSLTRNRFNSSLHQRDSRSSLFSSYDSRANSQSPHPSGRPTSSSGYGYGSNSNPYASSNVPPSGAFSAYPGNAPSQPGGFRAATPNSKGHYSEAVLSELESQNDEQVEGISAKVKMLKDITLAIGDEIRDSTALAEKMNDGFDSTRNRLRGTMNRMLRMAERTGISWKVWLGFFAAVILLFWYVWLF